MLHEKYIVAKVKYDTRVSYGCTLYIVHCTLYIVHCTLYIRRRHRA